MIKLENVTKTYKKTTVALRDANVEINKGEFVFLVGASGSGKSTFIRLLNKEETPESGHIYVAGKDIGRLSGWKVRAEPLGPVIVIVPAYSPLVASLSW